jgi:hypothetical protein
MFHSVAALMFASGPPYRILATWKGTFYNKNFVEKFSISHLQVDTSLGASTKKKKKIVTIYRLFYGIGCWKADMHPDPDPSVYEWDLWIRSTWLL